MLAAAQRWIRALGAHLTVCCGSAGLRQRGEQRVFGVVLESPHRPPRQGRASGIELGAKPLGGLLQKLSAVGVAGVVGAVDRRTQRQQPHTAGGDRLGGGGAHGEGLSIQTSSVVAVLTPLPTRVAADQLTVLSQLDAALTLGTRRAADSRHVRGLGSGGGQMRRGLGGVAGWQAQPA